MGDHDYPGLIDELGDIDGGHTLAAAQHALRHNKVNEAARLIRLLLGDNPAGGEGTVQGRLEGVDADVDVLYTWLDDITEWGSEQLVHHDTEFGGSFAEGDLLRVKSLGPPLLVESLDKSAYAPAAKGALYRVSGASIPHNTITIPDLSTQHYDDIGAWSAGNPSRLTVPAGVSRVRLSVMIRWTNNSTGSRYLDLRKNGSDFDGGAFRLRQPADVTSEMAASSAQLKVVPGDYFQIRLLQDSSVSLSPLSASWLNIEVLA